MPVRDLGDNPQLHFFFKNILIGCDVQFQFPAVYKLEWNQNATCIIIKASSWILNELIEFYSAPH